MTTFPFKLGALPPDPTRPRVHLADHLTAHPHPLHRSWIGKVHDFPMYGNDRYGDCAWAGAAHLIEGLSTYGDGTTVEVTDADVLAAYTGCTGFDPDDPATDQGTNLQDGLGYWRKTGIGGHKILAYADVNTGNDDELDAALNLFGGLYIGFTVYTSAMQQFSDGKAWDLPNEGGIEGGHCVNVGRYVETTDGKTKRRRAVTWAKRQWMTEAFWKANVTEAWVVIAPEWVNDASGKSPTGLDLAGLGQAVADLTGEGNPLA